MARLPVPGSDQGTWGDVLNSYLDVAHNPDGTLRSGSVNSAVADATTVNKGVVRLTGDLGGTANSPTVPGLVNKYELPNGGIPMTDLSSDVQTAISSGSTVGDATATEKGVIQLAGDLGGTAALPTVPGLADKYTLPTGGIPESDLSADVQAALSSGGSGNATQLQGAPIATDVPNASEVLTFDGTNWSPQAASVPTTISFPALDYTTLSVPPQDVITASVPWAAAANAVLIRQIRLVPSDPGAIFNFKVLRQNDFGPSGLNANVAFHATNVQGTFMREFMWDYEDEDASSNFHFWIQNVTSVTFTVRILVNSRVAQ